MQKLRVSLIEDLKKPGNLKAIDEGNTEPYLGGNFDLKIRVKSTSQTLSIGERL